MAFGVTSTGFLRKTFQDILDDVEQFQHDKIDARLDLSERTALGNINNILADHFAQLWEFAEDGYQAFDPDNAADDRVVALALLSGVQRESAKKGTVSCTVNLDASKTFAIGELVASVSGQPTNRWVNTAVVTSTTAGNYTAAFESEVASVSAIALAGTLTVIAESASGWNSVTNPLDAVAGTDQESIEALRARREASLAISGGGTLPALEADITAVDDVLEVAMFENTLDVFSAGLTPHSIRAVIWDGSTPLADDDEIATAIGVSKAAGIATNGSESGTDSNGVPQSFDRATEKPVFIDVTIESVDGVVEDDIKAAIIAAHGVVINQDVVYNVLTASVFAVAGVDDWSVFTIDFSGSPTGVVDLLIGTDEIATIDTGDITVTVV